MILYEYKTVVIDGHPDRILNAEAVDGWELVSTTPGGFRNDGRHLPVAVTLFLRRERQTGERKR